MENGRNNQRICFAEFELDTAHRRLLRAGEPVILNRKAFDLLVFLAANTGRVVTKDEIFEAVWNGQFVEEANLTVQMSALRKALGEKKESPQFLFTVPGRGYEFIADVHDGSDEIVIEKHKFERLVVEEEHEVKSEKEKTRISDRSPVRTTIFYLLPFTLLLLAVGAVWVASRNVPSSAAQGSEKQAKIRRLTNNGKVANAVLSADGKFFAYSQFDKPNWQTSIRLGQVDGASDVVLRPTADLIYRVTTFSADGAWLYYTAAPPRAAGSATLYKMPVLGGLAEKLADGISTYAVVSPDEKQIAFVRSNQQEKTSTLFVAGVDGSNERELAVRPYDKSFSARSLSWSADGSAIAISAANTFNENDDANQANEILTVSVVDGSINQLTNLEWSGISGIQWLKDGSGLAVTGRQKDPGSNAPPRRSLWLVDYPDGKARKLTLDLNSYASSVSLTSDAKQILVVQGQQESNVWIAPADDPASARQITFGSPGRIDGWYGIDWTPDGKIVYIAWIGESSTIWIMDADGSGARQITPVGFRDERPSVTGDGAFIVFESNRSGKSHIWRVGTDGSDLRQLTNGDGVDSRPTVTPDGRWIFYMNERGGESSVWRVSIGGDEPAQMISGATDPRVSPDGKFLACGYSNSGKTTLAMFSIGEGGILGVDAAGPFRTFDVAKTHNFYDSIRWTSDGEFITYRDWANGLWAQGVGTAGPRRVAGLPEEKLMTYGWSPDGKHLAITRGRDVLDAVLITDFR